MDSRASHRIESPAFDNWSPDVPDRLFRIRATRGERQLCNLPADCPEVLSRALPIEMVQVLHRRRNLRSTLPVLGRKAGIAGQAFQPAINAGRNCRSATLVNRN
jgi:hypothetical protein